MSKRARRSGNNGDVAAKPESRAGLLIANRFKIAKSKTAVKQERPFYLILRYFSEIRVEFRRIQAGKNIFLLRKPPSP